MPKQRKEAATDKDQHEQDDSDDDSDAIARTPRLGRRRWWCNLWTTIRTLIGRYTIGSLGPSSVGLCTTIRSLGPSSIRWCIIGSCWYCPIGLRTIPGRWWGSLC